MTNESLKYDLAFSLLKQMHGSKALEILRRVGSTQTFFSLSHSQLVSLLGIESKNFDDANRKEAIRLAEGEMHFINYNNIEVLFIGYDNYPKRLLECPDAPILLYKLGNAPLDSKHVVGIVGTRHATPYGINFTKKLIKELAEDLPDIVIVSGLAYGVDVTAHTAAMEEGVSTVAVLAHGLDTIYPSMHRDIAARMVNKNGALITEYPSKTPIYGARFLARNRIVAGLCDCLIVVESDYRGGSMSTARIAMQYNREVMALPGRITDTYSRGTNSLISKNIASLITSAKDLEEQLGWDGDVEEKREKTPTLFPVLTDEQKRVLAYLKTHTDATINEMCVGLGLTYPILTNRLMELEEEDIIMQVPGGRYVLLGNS